jgi:formylglycine-generating enzyme required for sulfatase activity/tRNA A-37 threonylcarbamoyl transferase component Bud32
MSSTADFLDSLRRLHLLEPGQLDELTGTLQGNNCEPRALAQKLIEKGWLTPYQVNQLLQGRGPRLVLGSYVLLERLGEGGMGEVFKAKNWKLGKVVAIKLIRRERLANETAVRRFHREAKAAAALSHANVVHAYDADQVGDTHIFVMEYVDGIDLNKLVKDQGTLSVDRACDCIRQAALGLQHAHERGLVHRDIKPHNLVLSRNGVVKILDMGLARIADDDSSTLTKEGSVMGTLDYLAPEQARDAHSADIRADLYSLGCTFHYLLTGQVLFPGGTASEKWWKHAFEEPTSIEKLRADVPPGVAAVIRKLLAKKPEERFQAPAELAALLAQGAALPVGAVQARPVPLALPVEADDTLAAGAGPPQARQASKRHRLFLLSTVGAALAVIVLLAIFLLANDNRSKAQLDTTARTTQPAEPKAGDIITNSIGMKLAYIPAGEFAMGSPQKEANHQGDEGPQHKVRITKAFYMGAYECRQGEYEKVMGKNPSAFKDSPDHPVEQVTWDEAVEFCKRLSELPDEKKTGRVYRLPTEAEWEYACRAGTTTTFHYGDSLSSKQANFNGGKTTKCGSYPPNAWALYDMHGNVWEWCLDGVRKYEPSDKPVQDPRGPMDAGGARVARGGSWVNGAWLCRSASRSPGPSARHYGVGFRVVEVKSDPGLRNTGRR